MFTNNSALVASLLATISGAIVGYLLFSKFVNRRYGSTKDTSPRFKFLYWGGMFCILIAAYGTMLICNELFFTVLNDSKINQNNIYKGFLFLVVIPFILIITLFLVSRFIPSDDESSKFNGANALTATLAIALAIVLFSKFDNTKDQSSQIQPKSSTSTSYTSPTQIFKSDNRFNIKSCTFCYKDDCKPTSIFENFSVYDDKIQVFMLDESGAKKIRTLPTDREYCSISRRGDHAFSCESSSSIAQFLATFDGSNQLIWQNKWADDTISRISCVVN